MKSLILLHGALGSSRQFDALLPLLSDRFEVYTFNFEGHGDVPVSGEFSIGKFSENLIGFMHENEILRPLIFGYSMGGYVALYTEAIHPGIIGEIITLGTKFHWTPESAEREIRMIHPDKIKEKVPQFATYLHEVHQPGSWEEMMLNTQELMRRLGDKPLLTADILANVRIPVSLFLGELDKMVSVEETENVRGNLKNARFEILEGIPHPIQMINAETLRDLIESPGRSGQVGV